MSSKLSGLCDFLWRNQPVFEFWVQFFACELNSYIGQTSIKQPGVWHNSSSDFDLYGVDREGIEDPKADGGLKTKEVATEDDEGEEKFLDIVDIFNG